MVQDIEDTKLTDTKERQSTSFPSEDREEMAALPWKPGAEKGEVLRLEQDEGYVFSVCYGKVRWLLLH